jgi:hypothetical protein
VQPPAGARRGEPDALDRLDLRRLGQVERHGVALAPGQEPPPDAAAEEGEVERQEPRDHLVERRRARRRRRRERQRHRERPARLQQVQVADVEHVGQGAHAHERREPLRPRVGAEPVAVTVPDRVDGAERDQRRRDDGQLVQRLEDLGRRAGRRPGAGERALADRRGAARGQEIEGQRRRGGRRRQRRDAERVEERDQVLLRHPVQPPDREAHHPRVDQGQHQPRVGQLARDHRPEPLPRHRAREPPARRLRRETVESPPGGLQELREHVQLAAAIEHRRRHRRHGRSPRST